MTSRRANIIRLLLLTGARSGEVRGMRWDQLDLDAGVWTKPGSTTKQKTEHRVPLSAPARQLLVELNEASAGGAEHVFPGRGGDGHRSDIQNDWTAICEAAGISEARMHDLRHTYASVLASRRPVAAGDRGPPRPFAASDDGALLAPVR